MRRHRLAVLLLPACAVLAGCGGISKTASISNNGISVSVVVTSDQAGLNEVHWGALISGEAVVAGDQHRGNQLCTTSFSHSGHSFTVTVYGSNLPADISAALCTNLKTSLFA